MTVPSKSGIAANKIVRNNHKAILRCALFVVSLLLIGYIAERLNVSVFAMGIAEAPRISDGDSRQNAPSPESQIPAVLVNEVLAHTDFPQQDFVELHNPSDTTVDLSGWYITDNLNEPTKFRIPAGTRILPNGYTEFEEDQLGFAFSSEGESIYLLAAAGDGSLTGYSHGFNFGATPNGFSLGRCTTPDGRGGVEEHFVLQETVTKGRQNEWPVVGPIVISEILYAPGSLDEFIELTNLSPSDQPLYDPDHSQNLWRITGVGAYEIPGGTQIAANGTLLIVPIDPAAFRSRYSIPPSIPVIGPYPGKLSNNGERISLMRPDTPNTNGTVPYFDADVVRYDSAPPWPLIGNSGKSIERIVLSEFGDSAVNWLASDAVGGTPGESPNTVVRQVRSESNGGSNSDQRSTWKLFLPTIASGRTGPFDSCFRTLGQ